MGPKHWDAQQEKAEGRCDANGPPSTLLILLDENSERGKLICSFALLQLIVGCRDIENNPERKYMVLLQSVKK